jgi:predicted cupin superfamily sugar epimerase
MALSDLISSLDLKPHPEGGFYRETFRDDSVLLSASSLPPQCKFRSRETVAVWKP